MKNLRPYIAIVTSMLIWSVAGIAIKEALTVFPPMTMIVIRFALAVLLMLIIGIAARNISRKRIADGQSQQMSGLALQKVSRKDLPVFLLGGFFQPFLYYLLETFTYDSLSSPTISEALLSTAPVFAPLFGIVFLREKVTRNNILGIVISTLGMLLLVLFGADSFALGNPWGLLTAFLAVSAALLYSVTLKRIPEHYNSLTLVFYMQAFSLLLFTILWLFTDKKIEPVTISSVLSIIYLAVFSSVTAFILFCYTVRRIGITRANAFNNIRPAFTAIAMFLIFSEHLPLGKLLGIVLIIIGLFICQYNKPPKTTAQNQ
ncbi:MAG: DMT family transporter [Paludibacteraceae bacterium]|nr:DMT family transporter [Paludibacteraceae bacterium]